MALRSQLESAWQAYVDAKEDGKFTLMEGMSIGALIAGIVEVSITQFTGDDDEWEALVADVEYFVETYVVPWDIPGIGPFFETFVDRQMVAMVRPLLERLRP